MEKAVANVTPDIRANFAGQLAGALARAGQWDQLKKFLRWIAEFPDAPPDTLQNVAWLLSTQPDEAARDPQFALACCDRLEKLPDDEPLFLLTKAAAVAAAGIFQKPCNSWIKPPRRDQQTKPSSTRHRPCAPAFESGKIWTGKVLIKSMFRRAKVLAERLT